MEIVCLGREKLIIRENSTLRANYAVLQEGDIIIGRLRLHDSEESMLLDLCQRGVHLVPSGLAQLASRSKVFQATLFSSFMLPLTSAIHSLHDLRTAMTAYQENSISAVVTKLDRKNAGMGVFLWQSIEEVFTHASLGTLTLPFILQPFEPDCRDIRVVLLDDYYEAYRRHNQYNFRNNLHHGGKSKECTISDEQQQLCRLVMERGRFPYAHIDLLITREGKSYLGEINLRGGIRGAKISPAQCQTRIEAIHEKLLRKLL